jgi:adenylate kinase family enzyme
MFWLVKQIDAQAFRGVSRISVVGPSGSGKTRLSRELHEQLDLPLYELDTIRFDRSGRAAATEAFVAAVSEVSNRDSWIVDGHYRDTRSIVWRRSQLVIWLNYPLPFVFWRLLRRGVAKKFAKHDGGLERPGTATDHEPGVRFGAASWQARLNRFAKTIRERGEYRSMLGSLESRGVGIIELRSAREASDLCLRMQPRSGDSLSKATVVSLELFGLPGAGKTTLTKAIDPDLDLRTRHELADEWKRQPFLRRAVIVMRTIADLRLMLAAIRFAAGSRINKRESLWRLVRLLSMKHWLRTRSGILLFDQGIMQNLWSILYAADCSDPDPRFIEPLLHALYDGTNTQIVLLEIDKTVAAKRVADRTYGRSRFDGMNELDIDALLARATRLVAVLIMAARGAGLPVRTLDGTASVAQLAKSLEAMVSRQVPNPGQVIG